MRMEILNVAIHIEVPEVIETQKIIFKIQEKEQIQQANVLNMTLELRLNGFQ